MSLSPLSFAKADVAALSERPELLLSHSGASIKLDACAPGRSGELHLDRSVAVYEWVHRKLVDQPCQAAMA
jgi:hypothetical protein